MDSTQQQAFDGLIEFWADTCFIRGKPVNREIKRYLKKKTQLSVTAFFNDSPSEAQFFARYIKTPTDTRRKWLDTICYQVIVDLALYEPLLRVFYLALWNTTEGIKLVELRRELMQLVGEELSEVVFEKLTKEFGTEELKLDTIALDFQPGNVSGADKRLKFVLESHWNEKSLDGEGKPIRLYDTDVKVALWECSEGKHLDEFAKLLSDNPKEAAADLRRLMKDSKAIRGIVLRILRKTITDLPDITDAVRDQRAQDNNKITLIHDEPVVNSEESLFDTIPSPEGNTTEERLEQLEQIAEWRNKTKMFTTRELKLYQNELSRLKAGKTREEFYDTPKSVTQQLKYMRHKYST